ncbi:arginine deiminase [Bacillus infantis]|uniref:arginine deiminase n=1 Tax=Bacillus infantis TaxID=324767 RepID=UPI000B9B4CB8|nr:arginine deiminase [Bacillus infantis]MCA1036855.1 arginine deiminase [Bacillus infantis]MCK6206953.1 arginine deiminase [Bacillus infantis]MCP1158357.1 arginine deiminase [Bacillus infantis]OXT15917.1 arginine deiminase [Bacillus sp. OG2]
MKHPLHVTSEIGELKSVLLHRPGKEVENLTPQYLKRLLFDDIPYLPAIQKEHDYFAGVLSNRGIEVLYLDKLMTETLAQPEIRGRFTEQILMESQSNVNGSFEAVSEYLNSLPADELVRKVMAGVRKNEIDLKEKVHLHEIMADSYPFFLDPMPNLYFTRDPAAVIGKGITINNMNEPARRRESIFMDYIIKHHPRFKEHDIPVFFNRDEHYTLEGGDELVLSREVAAIGVSARTSAQGIEKLARELFARQEDIKKVVAVEIPKSRAFMHLDTVFTMIDHDKFTYHPAIESTDGKMKIYILEQGNSGDLKITEKDSLVETLKEVLNLPELVLLPCGGGDVIAAAREQWNDGSNTLAIAPGVVVTYDRNYVSNDMMRQNGIEVLEIMSSELSRGRGGPRCMSMPIVREEL